MDSFEELMRKQGEVASLAAQLAGENDPAKVKAVLEKLQRESAQLQTMARSVEEQHKRNGQSPSARPDQALTEEQRSREAQMRTVAEQALAEIAKASPAAAEAVAKLRADPNFFGGILLKK